MLLPDDGSLPPKHGGEKNICIRTICFVCAISWFFNKKYRLHGMNYIKKFQAIYNYAGIYIIRYSICKTHITCCVLHELLLPALFQAVSEWSQCVQSFRACLTKRQTEWDRRRRPSHIKHANSLKEELCPSEARLGCSIATTKHMTLANFSSLPHTPTSTRRGHGHTEHLVSTPRHRGHGHTEHLFSRHEVRRPKLQGYTIATPPSPFNNI